MRAFLVLVIAVGLGFVYYRQKHNDAPPPVATKAASAASQPAPQLTPAPRGQASEYNWMKRSLDRAKDVTEQSRAQTKQGQDP